MAVELVKKNSRYKLRLTKFGYLNIGSRRDLCDFALELKEQINQSNEENGVKLPTERFGIYVKMPYEAAHNLLNDLDQEIALTKEKEED